MIKAACGFVTDNAFQNILRIYFNFFYCTDFIFFHAIPKS